MPFEQGDVNRFTKKAKSPRRRRQWIHTYNSGISKGMSEGAAIKMANGVIKKQMNKGRDKRSRSSSSRSNRR